MNLASKRIVEVMIDAGIDHVFGLPGGLTLSLFDALYDYQKAIRVILPRHEQAAACMADMYGRMTGKPGVFIAQGAFAASTGLFGILDAHLSSTPMLILTDTTDYGVFSLHGGLQSGIGEYGTFDVKNILEASAKYVSMPTTPNEAVLSVQLAIKHALSGRPGPAACIMRPQALGGLVNPKAFPKIYETGKYLRDTRSLAAPEPLAQAIEILASARRPAIIAGHGVRISRAEKELAKLAELLGAPVATTYVGKSAIPEIHPLALGVMGFTGSPMAQKVVGEADVLLIVGSRLKPPMDTCFENPKLIDSDRQKIIHLDIEPRNAGWVFPAEVCLCGDAKLVLDQLIKGLEGRVKEAENRVQALQKRKAEEGFLDDPCLRSEAIPILPQRVVGELDRVLDSSAILVTDGGNNRHWMAHYFKAKAVDSYFGVGGVGGVGWSVAAVMTAKLLHPERPCVAICSDGGFSMQIHMLATALQYQTPVIFLVMNDSALGMVRETQGPRRIASEYIDLDFAKIARAFGCLGIRVEKPGGIAPALEQALQSKVPVVIDVIVSKEEKMFGNLLSPLAKEALQEIGYRKEMEGEGLRG